MAQRALAKSRDRRNNRRMLHFPKHPFLAWLTLAVLLLTACTNRKKIDRKVFSVFSDFVFVGSGPYHGNSELDRTVPAHGANPMSLPGQLEIDKLYIFHHRRPLDGQALALSALPSRLRQQGIRITQAPTSTKELMFPYVGGPIFTIRFEDGTHFGFIFSQVCPNLTKEIDAGYTGTDYVLVYTRY